MSINRRAAVAALVCFVTAACADAPVPTAPSLAKGGYTAPGALVADHDPAVPLAFYDLTLGFTKRTGGFSPPVQARAYGYMGLALYESLVAGMPGHRSVAHQLDGVGDLPAAAGVRYHWPLVANAALAEVMRGLWGGRTNRAADNVADIDALEASFEARHAHVPPGIAKLSAEYGRRVGAAVFATSQDDGGHEGYLTTFPAYTPPTGPGLWVPTAPGQLAIQPYWGSRVRTLAIAGPATCDPGSPVPYSEEPGSAFHQEAMEVYHAVRSVTPEQFVIARFWADGPGTFSGPGHSFAIVGEILRQQQADLGQAAEAYARAGVANADALTTIWWAKYHYNLIRPVTFIRRAVDQSFGSLVPTPGFPEYPSAHSGQSAAVAVTLESLFGDRVAFVDHAHDADGFAPRAFPSIFAAAEEAGMSRIYAGIHFPMGNLAGRRLGQCVGAAVNGLEWRR